MVSKLKPTFITDEFVKAILDSIATGNKIILTTSIGSSTIYTDQQLNGINYQQTQGSSKNITRKSLLDPKTVSNSARNGPESAKIATVDDGHVNAPRGSSIVEIALGPQNGE